MSISFIIKLCSLHQIIINNRKTLAIVRNIDIIIRGCRINKRHFPFLHMRFIFQGVQYKRGVDSEKLYKKTDTEFSSISTYVDWC